jgi:hypothetical protein
MKAPMQPSLRRRPDRQAARLRAAMAAAMVAAAVLVGLDTVAWFRLQRAIDRRLDGFAHDARASGWHFSALAGARGGWPFSATLTLRHPSLVRALADDPGTPGGTVAWTGDAVTLSLSPWHPAEATIVARGTQSLSVTPNAGLPMPVRFWGARVALLLPAEDRGAAPNRVVLEADALHVALPGAGPDDVVQVAEARGHVQWNVGVAALSLSLRDFALPIALGRPEGRVVQHVWLDARLRPASAGTMAPGPASPGPAAADRLQAEAEIMVDRAAIDWDGNDAVLAGHAALQPDRTCSGRFDLSVADADRMLSKMRETGLLTSGAAIAARAVAGLVVAAAPGPRLHLNLELHRNLLSLGNIPLLRVPTIAIR